MVSHMKKHLQSVCYAALTACVILPAASIAAEEKEPSLLPYGFSVTLGAASDYVFLGISQTGGEPALQGSIDWAHDSGFYLGAWASNVDFEDNSGVKREFDFYGGYTHEFGALSTDLSLMQVAYSNAVPGVDYNYTEAKLGLEYPINEWFSLTSEFRYSPDYSGDSGDEEYAEAGASFALPHDITLNTAFGRQWVEKNANYGYPDYNNWRVGAAYSFADFDFGLTYSDTNISSAVCPENCDGRVVLSVSRTF